MFAGSIPNELKGIVHEHVGDWKVDEVHVACSGNLTLERALEGRVSRLHSNDVSIYTGAIASWLAGQPFRLGVREEHHPEWGWLEEHMKDPIGQVATMLLATRMFFGWEKSNTYYDRVRQAHVDQWPTLYAKTREKLDAISLRVADYFSGDVRDYLAALDRKSAVISYPTGSDAGVARTLESLFDWDEPEFSELDAEGLPDVLGTMREFEHWLYAVRERQPDHDKWLCGSIEKRGDEPIYVYSSKGSKRIVGIRRTVKPLTQKRLVRGDELTGNLTLARLKEDQFAALRGKYLAANILGATPEVAIGILDEGRLLGVCAFKREEKGRADAFLLADFPVAPTDYPRLSKLVVHVALSQEVKLLVERVFGRRMRTVVTSAFTNNPTSMKYRGTLDLVKRDRDGGQGREYRLVYHQKLGIWSLADAFESWEKKHGQRA